MVDDNILCLSKECITEYHTASGLITSKPCFVFSCVLAPTAFTSGAILLLRNGETIASDILISIRAKYTETFFQFPIPIYFSRGLFLDFQGNLSGVSVQYRIEQ